MNELRDRIFDSPLFLIETENTLDYIGYQVVTHEHGLYIIVTAIITTTVRIAIILRMFYMINFYNDYIMML